VSVRCWYVFFLLLGLQVPPFSAPLSANEDVLWKNLRPSKDIEMLVLDDFEERVRWSLANSLAIESSLRFVDNSPLENDLRSYPDKKRQALYNREIEALADSAKIHGRVFSKSQRSSQELIVFFSNPGNDYQAIEIPQKDRRFITGRPVAISVWVFGKNKRHVLYALFSNQVAQKIPVKIGDLNFQGWKRLEVAVPITVSHRNRLNHKVLEFRFDGFKVVSHPNETVGSFSFLHDLVCVLVDTRGAAYAGSKIEDHWE